ncbi:Uncharacterised protein [Mycobacteroides abscessus subsp. abscessus]|nr:Uncharacterised protein [Mycobacteroides abscessus subsp. abscessus]
MRTASASRTTTSIRTRMRQSPRSWTDITRSRSAATLW